MYIELFIAESKDDLQSKINYHKNCKQWKLTANINKTKVLVFPQGQTPKYLIFHLFQ